MKWCTACLHQHSAPALSCQREAWCIKGWFQGLLPSSRQALEPLLHCSHSRNPPSCTSYQMKSSHMQVWWRGSLRQPLRQAARILSWRRCPPDHQMGPGPYWTWTTFELQVGLGRRWAVRLRAYMTQFCWVSILILEFTWFFFFSLGSKGRIRTATYMAESELPSW